MSETAVPPRALEDLPSPPGLPFVGHVLALDVSKLHLQLEDWARTYGETYTFRIGPRRFLVVAGLESALTVLRERPHAFRRYAQIEDVLAEMGGNGVFSAEGAEWQRQRRLVTKALTPRQIEEEFPAFHTITGRLLAKWQGDARASRPSDVLVDLTRYTVDMTMTLLFGVDINTLETEGQVIQDHIHQILPMVNVRINAPVPYWRYVKLPKDRRLDRALEALYAFLDDLVADARAKLARGDNFRKRSLLEAMVALRDEPGSEFEDSDLNANLVTLLLTGEDTTAYSLAWMIETLADDSALQERLNAVTREAWGAGSVPDTFAALEALELLEHFALEVMRRRSPAPLISMESNVPTVLDGVAIPAHTPILVLTRPSGLDARYFGDPCALKPERWSAEKDAACRHEARAFLHFGAGPRFCPGRFLSIVEIKLALAMLARSFSVRRAEDASRTEEVFGFTMKPSRLRVQFAERA